MSGVETLDKLARDLALPEDVGLSLLDTRFLKYFAERPGSFFYSASGFDPVGIALYEKDIQDFYDSRFSRMTGGLPSGRIRFEDEGFMMRDYARNADIPVVYDNGAASPITSVGFFKVLEYDLRRAAKLADDAAAAYGLSSGKRKAKLGLGGYVGVFLCSVAASVGALFGAYSLMWDKIEDKMSDMETRMYVAEGHLRTLLTVQRNTDGSARLSPEVAALVSYVKNELEVTTRAQLDAYFSVRYVDNKPVFNEDLESFLVALEARADHDLAGLVERIKNDEELRRQLIDTLVDAIMDD